MKRSSQTKVEVRNIYSQATEEQVRQLLECIGPLVKCEFRRDGDVKFSAVVEYHDPQTAEVSVRQLNGYKFQNRELKVKLYNQQQGQQQNLNLDVERPNITAEQMLNNLPAEKKLAILYEIQQTFKDNQQQLQQLLKRNPLITKCLSKALDEVHLRYPETQYRNPPMVMNQQPYVPVPDMSYGMPMMQTQQYYQMMPQNMYQGYPPQ